MFMTVGSIMKAGARRTDVSSKQGTAVWTHSWRTQNPLSAQETQAAEGSELPCGAPQKTCVGSAGLENSMLSSQNCFGKQGSRCDS